MCIGVDTSIVRRLVVAGSNFGPSSDVSGDAVGRFVEYAPYLPASRWDRSKVLFASSNWTHSAIEAFSLEAFGAIRVTLDLVDPAGVPRTRCPANRLLMLTMAHRFPR